MSALERSSVLWSEGDHDIIPWVDYFLHVLRLAYQEFEKRAMQVQVGPELKRAHVETAIDALPGKFTLAELEQACLGTKRDFIRRTLQQLQKTGSVVCQGRGLHAAWNKTVVIQEAEVGTPQPAETIEKPVKIRVDKSDRLLSGPVQNTR